MIKDDIKDDIIRMALDSYGAMTGTGSILFTLNGSLVRFAELLEAKVRADDRKLLEQALEALEVLTDNYDKNAVGIEIDAIIALRKRLAQPEQRPVVVIKRNESGQITMQTPDGNPFDMSKYIGAKLYATPQKREWVGLTNEEVGALTVFDGLHHVEIPILANFVWAVEAKLKEKNT